jgi:hypothetical protein
MGYKNTESGETKVTSDHEEIRQWASTRGGTPAALNDTFGREGSGGLRIDFLHDGDDRVQQISWQEFFTRFDEKGLVMMYQEQTEAGKTSRFCKIVHRDHVEQALAEL